MGRRPFKSCAAFLAIVSSPPSSWKYLPSPDNTPSGVITLCREDNSEHLPRRVAPQVQACPVHLHGPSLSQTQQRH